MPGTLNSPVRQHITKRHLEVLMSAIVCHSRDPAMAPNETQSLPVRAHYSQHALGRNLIHRRNRFKTVLWAHYVDYPDKFT